MTQSSTRLNKYLAHALGISRREADDLIARGKVTIDTLPATMGAQVHPGSSVIVQGKPVQTQNDYSYVAFHKPVGYVCSRKAQGDNPTIYDLLPAGMASLKPVGRLDKNSSGILLLTNDGDFAHRMTHPKFSKTKIYEVALDKSLEPLHQQMIVDYGVEIGDGASKLILEKRTEDRKGWIVTMHEGRNRQIRRTFAALGYEVTVLHRTNFGTFAVHGLPPGAYKEVAAQ